MRSGDCSANKKTGAAKWRTRIRTTTKYRSEQRKSFRETGRTSLLPKSLLVYALESCNKNANCIHASVLPFCLCRHPSRRMRYNAPLNQRTICRRDCHEREKIICIHAHGLRPLAAAGGASRCYAGKYLRSIRAFAAWLGSAAVTKDVVTEWKAHLVQQRQAPPTINTALAALNGLLRFLGWEDCRAKFLNMHIGFTQLNEK